jgi:hypothetical protein
MEDDMAKIQVTGSGCTVTLSEPDEDGEYGWVAGCGGRSESVQAMGDTVADAEVHTDIQCPWVNGILPSGS